MNILVWVLAGACVMLLCFGVLMCHALTIALDERERWYQPIKPVEFEYLDGEVEEIE